MNNFFSNWRKSGITQSQALAYAVWLNQSIPEMSLRLKFWVPTPLPIGYLGKDNQLVRLPFLDLRHKSCVFGVMVGNVCFSKIFLREYYELCTDTLGPYYKVHDDGGDIWKHGLLGIDSKLQSFRMKVYPTQNFPKSVLACESKYARGLLLPNLNQIQQAYLLKEAFNGTMRILSENGIDVNAWDDKSFICCNDCTKKVDERKYMAVDFSTGVVENYADAKKEEDKFFARAVFPTNKYDPPYPVDEHGCFDWNIWEKYCDTSFM